MGPRPQSGLASAGGCSAFRLAALGAGFEHAYRGIPALYERDHDGRGFEWIDCDDSQQSVISFIRRDSQGQFVLCVCNFTPVTRMNYRVGAPLGGYWKEILNSDATLYGGSGRGNQGGVTASPAPMHGRPYSLSIVLPRSGS